MADVAESGTIGASVGVTFIPAMAIDAGVLVGTGIVAKPLRSDHGFRRIALIWRRSSPRESEFLRR